MEGIEIELGLERKMIQVRLHFQLLQFDKAAQHSKEVIGLGGDRVGGRLG